uniref:Uncharacterized protein n=1 Tax=Molossus molossus TaxID=27622 RepID=A0A7J8CRW2_MOLMO|nr:hypothetical protein HJG59_009733 [Molossus molossus]
METADTLFIFVRPSWVSTLHFLPDKQTKLLSRAARRPSGVGAAEESYFVARFSEVKRHGKNNHLLLPSVELKDEKPERRRLSWGRCAHPGCSLRPGHSCTSSWRESIASLHCVQVRFE